MRTTETLDALRLVEENFRRLNPAASVLWEELGDLRAKRPPPGGRTQRVPDEDLVLIAAEYAKLVAEGVDNARVVLAQGHGQSVSWVRERLANARKRKLLSPGRHGLAGGVLTPGGELILQAMRRQAEEDA